MHANAKRRFPKAFHEPEVISDYNHISLGMIRLPFNVALQDLRSGEVTLLHQEFTSLAKEIATCEPVWL